MRTSWSAGTTVGSIMKYNLTYGEERFTLLNQASGPPYFIDMGKNLYDKVWDLHAVRPLPGGETQLLVGLHLIHEVTSPQAFGMLRDLGLPVSMPERTFATVDHIIPTDNRKRPFGDPLAEGMVRALKEACTQYGIRFFDVDSRPQGIVHIIGPELGLTHP